MKKFGLLFCAFLFIFAITSCAAILNNYKYTDNKYKKEHISLCSSQKEVENNSKLPNKVNCTSANTNLYPKKDIDLAIDFAKKVKYAYRNRDMDYFANILTYPLNINYNKTVTTINSKEEFMELDKNVLFGDNKFEEIDKNGLFNNYMGFMLGNGLIWFWSENEISNIVINL